MFFGLFCVFVVVCVFVSLRLFWYLFKDGYFLLFSGILAFGSWGFVFFYFVGFCQVGF